MAHELNELAPNMHSFASAREDAWHKLGVTLDQTFNAETALEKAHLANWNVRKTEIKAFENGNEIAIPNRFATVYTNPVTKKTQYLGVVGSSYTPIQNEAHVSLLDAIVDESGAHFETAGSLREGRETFISMKLPSTMRVGGNDPVDLYLVAFNSHDGTSSFRFAVTPVRVVCANTQAAALAAAKSTFAVRHVKGATGVIAEARQALDLTFAYLDEFEVEAERMISAELRDSEFQQIVERLFDLDVATSKRQENTAADHVANVMTLWRDSPTMTGITGTKWGAYQAVTEYTDHFMSVRNTHASLDVARANRTVISKPIKNLKEKAFAVLA